MIEIQSLLQKEIATVLVPWVSIDAATTYITPERYADHLAQQVAARLVTLLDQVGWHCTVEGWNPIIASHPDWSPSPNVSEFYVPVFVVRDTPKNEEH